MKKIILKNTHTEQEIELGTSIYPYALETTDFGTVQGLHNAVRYINLNGFHLSGTSLGTRPIFLAGHIHSKNEGSPNRPESVILDEITRTMELRQMFMNRFINPRQPLSVTYNDTHELIFNPRASIEYSKNKFERSQLTCKWLIIGDAHYPLWKLAESRIQTEIAFLNDNAIFELIIPEGIGKTFGSIIPDESLQETFNDGDVDAGFVIKIEALGTIVNPMIKNKTTGEFIEVFITMQRGDVLEISTEISNKYARHYVSGIPINVFNQITTTSTPSMVLVVGLNEIVTTAHSGTTYIKPTLSYSPSFLEVRICT